MNIAGSTAPAPLVATPNPAVELTDFNRRSLLRYPGF